MALSYMAAIPIGLAIGIAYAALAYFAGSITNSEKLRAYSKIEVGELVVCAILITIVVLAYGSNELLTAVAGDKSATMDTYEKIENEMQAPLMKSVDSLMLSSYSLSKYVSYYYNIHGPTPYISPIFSDSPGSGLGPLQMQLSMGLDSVALNLFLVKAVKTLYLFLEFVLTTMALPLGIILRCIPPTRKIGGVLIGTALAVHFVFPTAVEWTTQMAPVMMEAYYAAEKTIPWVSDPGDPASAGLICSEVMQTTYGMGDALGPLLVCLVACLPTLPFGGYLACLGVPGIYPVVTGGACTGLVGNLWGFGQYMYPVATIPSLAKSALELSPEKAAEIFRVIMREIMPSIVQINLAVLIMVVIQLASTIVLARAFANALGADGQLYGIGRLI